MSSIIKKGWLRAVNESDDYQEKYIADSLQVVYLNPVNIFPTVLTVMCMGAIIAFFGYISFGVFTMLASLTYFVIYVVIFTQAVNKFKKKYLGE